MKHLGLLVKFGVHRTIFWYLQFTWPYLIYLLATVPPILSVLFPEFVVVSTPVSTAATSIGSADGLN